MELRGEVRIEQMGDVGRLRSGDENKNWLAYPSVLQKAYPASNTVVD